MDSLLEQASPRNHEQTSCGFTCRIHALVEALCPDKPAKRLERTNGSSSAQGVVYQRLVTAKRGLRVEGAAPARSRTECCFTSQNCTLSEHRRRSFLGSVGALC
jgi:hypothetical protein